MYMVQDLGSSGIIGFREYRGYRVYRTLGGLHTGFSRKSTYLRSSPEVSWECRPAQSPKPENLNPLLQGLIRLESS